MASLVMASTYAYTRFNIFRIIMGSIFGLLMTPENRVATVKGNKWLVKKITAKKPGRYDGSKFQSGLGAVGTQYLEFQKTMDAEFSLEIDSLEELANMVDGGKPTGAAAIELSLKQAIEKFDQLATADFLSQMDVNNVLLESSYDLDYSGILATLDSLAQKYTDANYDGKVLCVLSSKYYKEFKKALRENKILANPSVVGVKITKDFVDDNGDKIEGIVVPVEVVQYGNFYIKEAPQDRTAGEVLDCDGHTVGQEDGGTLPLKNKSTYRDVYAQFYPIEDSVFAELAHVNVQIAFPPVLQGTDYQADLDAANKEFYGSVNIVDAGINQSSDGIAIHGRIVGGSGIYRPELCFAITSTAAAQAVVIDKIKFVDTLTQKEITDAKITTDGGTFSVQALFEPCTANGTGVCTWTEADSTVATVSGSADISNSYMSTGLLPRSTATITATGNGTTKIKIALGSSVGSLEKELTVVCSNQT